MNSFEQTINTISTPTSAAAMIAFRRNSIEGDEENEPSRMILPSPRREPLQVLQKNDNNSSSRESFFEGFPKGGKDEATPQANANANAKPPFTTNPQQRTPLKTPSSKSKSMSFSSPFAGGRTPNAGKILSPLPLQPRKLQTTATKKKKVEIDTDEFLSRVPSIQTNDNDGTMNDYDGDTGCFAMDGDGAMDGDEGYLLDLRISKPFDDDDVDEDDDDNSLGWSYTLHDFKFVRKLGSGGSADVYEVIEKGSCAMYALKVQPATEDAMCELDLHIPLKHKNVCQMFDYFYSDVLPFAEFDSLAIDRSQGQSQEGQSTRTRYLCTVLEACDHGDLHDLIDEHVTVPEDLAAKVMLDAIRALQYLHSKDMIHCDIKPANWLVDGEDDEAVIKLADFGMTVTSDAKEIVGGSPVYMAPEHLLAWRDLTDEFDHRTDIYSLGVVLYEMLMGYLPYEVLEEDRSEGHQNAEIGDAYESLAKAFVDLSVPDPLKDNGLSMPDPLKDNLSTEDGSVEKMNSEQYDYGYPVLDLRKLNDVTSEEEFYIPPPIFVEEISMDAQDLIMRLMEPSLSKRITLEEAQDHEWFRKFNHPK